MRWYLYNVLKGILRKRLDSNIVRPKIYLQPRPMKLTVSQCKKRVWVSEWVVTSSQELPNTASQVREHIPNTWTSSNDNFFFNLISARGQTARLF